MGEWVRVCVDACVHVCVDGCVQEHMDGWVRVCVDGCVCGWVHAWMGACMDGWVCACVGGWVGGCVRACVRGWVQREDGPKLNIFFVSKTAYRPRLREGLGSNPELERPLILCACMDLQETANFRGE